MKVKPQESKSKAHRIIFYYLFFLGLFLSSPVTADLPLTVENLLSDQGKTRFDFSLNYTNGERRGIDVADPISIQTGENTYINLPTQFGDRLNNVDVLVGTASVRYGLTDDAELYGRVAALGIDRRAETVTGSVLKDKDTRFADAWVGLNYRFRDDADRAAWLGFAEVSAAERLADGELAHGKSVVAGVTTYQTFDPVVLSATATVRWNAEREVDGVNYRPGASVSLNPSVGFAVNDRVTLTTGLNWRMQQANQRAGQTNGIRRTRTRLELGAGFALDKQNTVNVSARPQVSGDGDVSVVLNWIHRLEK